MGTPFVHPTVVGTPFPSAEAHAAGVRDLTTQLEDTRQALAEAEERVHQLEVQMNGLVHYIAAWEGGDRQGRGAATIQSEIWALGRSVSDRHEADYCVQVLFVFLCAGLIING